MLFSILIFFSNFFQISSAFDLAVKIMELSEVDGSNKTFVSKRDFCLLSCEDLYSLNNFCDSRISNLIECVPRNFELACLMSIISPFVDELVFPDILFDGSSNYKKLLYFKFKHRVFLGLAIERVAQLQLDSSAAYSSVLSHLQVVFDEDVTQYSRRDLMVRLLESAWEVWEVMHGLGFHGYGRGVRFADPHAEGVEVIERVAILHCISGNSSRALHMFLRAIVLVQEIWGHHGELAPISTKNIIRTGLVANTFNCLNSIPPNLSIEIENLREEVMSRIGYLSFQVSDEMGNENKLRDYEDQEYRGSIDKYNSIKSINNKLVKRVNKKKRSA